MKELICTQNLENENALVATFNADPFAIENDEQLAEVMKSLGEYAYRYDREDEEFEELAAKLDGNADTYEYIFANNNVIVGKLK